MYYGYLWRQTLLITGGGKAKSIGYGITIAYANEGANIAITGRNDQKLIDAKEELERLYGLEVLALPVDGFGLTAAGDSDRLPSQIPIIHSPLNR